MPEQDHVSQEHADHTADAGHGADAHADAGHGAAHAHEWTFGAVLSHHNHAFPAIEWLHGKPLVIFNLPAYAAKNLEYLSHYDAYAEAEPSGGIQTWANQYAEAKGYDAAALGKAMVVAEGKASIAVFPQFLSFFNQQTFWGSIALLLMAVLVGVIGKRSKDAHAPCGRVQTLIESIVKFVRDDIVRPNIHHGDKWTAHFAALFLAILSFNLMGLIPLTGTASGNPGVTGAFAFTTLVTMLLFGMKEQGVGAYWKNLIPVPFTLKPMGLFVWTLLAIIEVMGLIIKPAALAIRLFANMFAGHTVLLAFLTLGFILFHSNAGSAMSAGLGIAGFGLGCAIYLLELLVALIQAYVFTLLSAVFIGASIHPEH